MEISWPADTIFADDIDIIDIYSFLLRALSQHACGMRLVMIQLALAIYVMGAAILFALSFAELRENGLPDHWHRPLICLVWPLLVIGVIFNIGGWFEEDDEEV